MKKKLQQVLEIRGEISLSSIVSSQVPKRYENNRDFISRATMEITVPDIDEEYELRE
ncbi:hypothetical protein [Photobacterium leiognathi]|uniref:hypothetical protein n=1 Tax=Photobacterium leiognathi TaxID=553611 RepID=UPI0029822E3B|nr:hypothetical protein [Photobacterium leiognathi]